MKEVLRISVIVALLCTIRADPTPRIQDNPSGLKRLWNLFGFGENSVEHVQQPMQPYYPQYAPCGMPMTTTPAPGPLCPYPPLPQPLPVHIEYPGQSQYPGGPFLPPQPVSGPQMNPDSGSLVPLLPPTPLYPKPVTGNPSNPLLPSGVLPGKPSQPSFPIPVQSVNPSQSLAPISVPPMNPLQPLLPIPVPPVIPPQPSFPIPVQTVNPSQSLPPVSIKPQPGLSNPGFPSQLNPLQPGSLPTDLVPEPVPHLPPPFFPGQYPFHPDQSFQPGYYPPQNPFQPTYRPRPIPTELLPQPAPSTGLIPSSSIPVAVTGPAEGSPVIPQCFSPLPFVPPGFNLISYREEQCGEKPVDKTPCSMLEMFARLRLRALLTLIEHAKLEQLFLQTYNYTIFAPVDIAFEKLPRWFMESLVNDPKLLRLFLLNHFIKIDLPLADMGQEFLVLNGRPGGNRLRSNIYFEDVDYRVITVDGSRILKGDILTNNGRLHIIDDVLTPNPIRNAAQYMTEVSSFHEFMNLVNEAQLIHMFQSANPITVFLPYNKAIEALHDGRLEAIRSDPHALRNFVKYHVVNGTYYSNGLISGQYLTTNYLKEIKVSITSDGFTKYLSGVNGDIQILKSDIPISNGVIHIIGNCISSDAPFYLFEESNDFGYDFEILKRSMTLTNKEKKEEASL